MSLGMIQQINNPYDTIFQGVNVVIQNQNLV